MGYCISIPTGGIGMTDMLVCRHCGQIVFEKVAEYSVNNTPKAQFAEYSVDNTLKAQFDDYGEDQLNYDEYPDDEEVKFDITTWRLLKCGTCLNISLACIHDVEYFNIIKYNFEHDPPDHLYAGSYEEKILYPAPILDID